MHSVDINAKVAIARRAAMQPVTTEDSPALDTGTPVVGQASEPANDPPRPAPSDRARLPENVPAPVIDVRSSLPLTDLELGYPSEDEEPAGNESSFVGPQSQLRMSGRISVPSRRNALFVNTQASYNTIMIKGSAPVNPAPGTFTLPPVPNHEPLAPRGMGVGFTDEDKDFFVKFCLYQLHKNPNTLRATIFWSLANKVPSLFLSRSDL